MSIEKIGIIIADDHVVVREGTRELLQKEVDLEVVGEAGDSEEAVRLVRELSQMWPYWISPCSDLTVLKQLSRSKPSLS